VTDLAFPKMSEARRIEVAEKRAEKGTYRLPRRSAKGRKFEAAYRAHRSAVLARTMCEAQTPDCTVMGVHVHHMGGRKRSDANDPGLLLLVCDECHKFIHANPRLSRSKGWMVSRVANFSPGEPCSASPATSRLVGEIAEAK
jgi:hypothetical protein